MKDRTCITIAAIICGALVMAICQMAGCAETYSNNNAKMGLKTTVGIFGMPEAEGAK